MNTSSSPRQFHSSKISLYILKRCEWLLLPLYQGPEPMLWMHCSQGLFCNPGPTPHMFRRSHFRLHVLHDARDSSSERWNLVGKNDPEILPKCQLPRTFRNLLHAVNLRHGTNGFTSPSKEGALRIFCPWKSWRLRPDLNPWTWVLKGSTLLLDHRSRLLVTS